MNILSREETVLSVGKYSKATLIAALNKVTPSLYDTTYYEPSEGRLYRADSHGIYILIGVFWKPSHGTSYDVFKLTTLKEVLEGTGTTLVKLPVQKYMYLVQVRLLSLGSEKYKTLLLVRTEDELFDKVSDRMNGFGIYSYQIKDEEEDVTTFLQEGRTHLRVETRYDGLAEIYVEVQDKMELP